MDSISDGIFERSSVDNCRFIELDSLPSENGRICVAENTAVAPFEIKRIYYLYDLPGGTERGGHAHIANRSLLVALSGAFDIVVDDGHQTRRVTINRPDRPFYLDRGIWRTLDNFSSGTVCLVLTSEKYDENDYIRDYEEFKRLTSVKR